MFLPHFDVFCDLLLNRRMATWNLFVLYNNETNYYRQSLFLISKSVNSKTALCPLWRTRKKPFDVICCLYKLKRSHSLLCVAKNCNWSRKITPLSNLISSVASRGMKTYNKSRVELRNLQILKKMLDKSSQVFSKSLDVASNIAGVEKLRSENMRLRSTWRPFDSSFE